MSSKTKVGLKKRKNKSDDVILIESQNEDLEKVVRNNEVVKDKNEAIYISDEDSVCEVVDNNETVKKNGGTNTFYESFLSSIAEMIYKEAKKINEEDNKKDESVNKIIEESTNNNTINSNYETYMVKNEDADISGDEIVISSDEDNVEERLNKRFVPMLTPTIVFSCEENEFTERPRIGDSIPKVKNKKETKQEQKKTQKENESENSSFYDCDFEDLLDNLKDKNKNGLQEQKTTTGAENSKRPRTNASDGISQNLIDLSKDEIGSLGQVQDRILWKLLNGEAVQVKGPASSAAASAPLVINQGLPAVTLQGVPLPVTYGTNVILVQFFKPNIQVVQRDVKN